MIDWPNFLIAQTLELKRRLPKLLRNQALSREEVVSLLEQIGRKLSFEVAHNPQKEPYVSRVLD